jgi:hypothetical protein
MNKLITKYETLDKRNPPPLMMSLALSGDQGFTVYKKIKKRIKKQK